MRNLDIQNNIEMSEQRIIIGFIEQTQNQKYLSKNIKGNVRINKCKIYKPSVKIKSGDIITINQ